jgi:hypothetical protein
MEVVGQRVVHGIDVRVVEQFLITPVSLRDAKVGGGSGRSSWIT